MFKQYKQVRFSASCIEKLQDFTAYLKSKVHERFGNSGLTLEIIDINEQAIVSLYTSIIDEIEKKCLSGVLVKKGDYLTEYIRASSYLLGFRAKEDKNDSEIIIVEDFIHIK